MKAVIVLLLLCHLSLVKSQQCYVRGEIQGVFIDGHVADSYNECLSNCNNDAACLYFTYNAMRRECIEFSIYQSLDTGCTNCYSGERDCPTILECNIDGLCSGVLVDYGVVSSENDCLNECKLNPSCQFYAYREDDGTCALLEDCLEITDCQTCHSGQKDCKLSSNGKELYYLDYLLGIIWFNIFAMVYPI